MIQDSFQYCPIQGLKYHFSYEIKQPRRERRNKTYQNESTGFKIREFI